MGPSKSMVVPSLPIEMLVILNSPVPVGFVVSTAFVAADVSSKTDTSIVYKKLLITVPFFVVVNGKTTETSWQAIVLGATMVLIQCHCKLVSFGSWLKGR